jgi:hypothetical protein
MKKPEKKKDTRERQHEVVGLLILTCLFVFVCVLMHTSISLFFYKSKKMVTVDAISDSETCAAAVVVVATSWDGNGDDTDVVVDDVSVVAFAAEPNDVWKINIDGTTEVVTCVDVAVVDVDVDAVDSDAKARVETEPSNSDEDENTDSFDCVDVAVVENVEADVDDGLGKSGYISIIRSNCCCCCARAAAHLRKNGIRNSGATYIMMMNHI